MISILLYIILSSASLAGWGSLVLRISRTGNLPNSHDSTERWALAVLVGHLPVLLIGYIAHLWAPLGGWPGAFFLLGGIVLLHYMHPPALEHRSRLLILLLLAAVSIFFSREMIHGDSGGYHTQAIMWMSQEPVVRGLVNLHSTFGYNSSWWILSALMSWPFGEPFGATMVSAPLLAAVGCLIAVAFVRLVQGTATAADWFWVPAFYLWLRQLVGVNTPSPANDIPANLLVLSATWIAVRAWPEQGYRFIAGPAGLVFLSLALVAATAKLSAAPLLLFGLLWLLAACGMETLARQIPALPRPLPGFVFPLLLGLAFLWHGWLLSGYPLYPSSFGGCWDVTWNAPADLPAQNFERARQWAFTFGADVGTVQTQPAWKIWIMGQQGITNIIIAGICALMLGSAALALLFRPAARSRIRGYVLPAVIIPAAGLVWNLASAPALRFASGFAFALFGSVAAILSPALPLRWTRIVVVTWILVCLAALTQLAISRPPSWLYPSAPPQGQPGHVLATQEGYSIHLTHQWDSWFAPKPSIPAFEFNPDLQTIQDPQTGRVREFRH